MRYEWLQTYATGVCILAMLVSSSGASAQGQTTGDRQAEASARLTAAAAIQGATRARLGVLGDAFTCADARFASFRRSDAEPSFADQWYVASQVWADTVFLHAAVGDPNAASLSGGFASESVGQSIAPLLANWDPQDTRCYIDKGLVFLDRLWDYSNAGYFPRADPVGTTVDRGTRFTDDNLVAGLMFLAAAQTSADPYARRRYIHAAQREADFLLLESTGLWDTTFGGGFWWNTGRGDSVEGKPAQTNALAALFFARLYAATDDATYREWSVRTLLWLDTILYQPARHLYRWSVSFLNIPARTGAVINERYFNYDQAIAVEAQLATLRMDGNASRLARARDVAGATQSAFWAPDLGGYNLEAGIGQVYASYGAWTSLGDLALYDEDHDPSWLDPARANVTALENQLREADNGFAYRAYRCVDRVAPGCASGQTAIVVDHTRDTVAQAWVQHLQAALAERLRPAAVREVPLPLQVEP